MGRSQDSFSKREREKIKERKRKDKEKKKLAKKENQQKDNFDDMIAYVDSSGNISSTPPDGQKTEEIDPESIEISIPRREDVDENRERTGEVIFFNESKGFGFIRDDETNEEFFVHINQLEGPVKEKTRLSFRIEKGPRGNAAVGVKLI